MTAPAPTFDLVWIVTRTGPGPGESTAEVVRVPEGGRIQVRHSTNRLHVWVAADRSDDGEYLLDLDLANPVIDHLDEDGVQFSGFRLTFDRPCVGTETTVMLAHTGSGWDTEEV